MSISIKHNKPYKLKIPKFDCDFLLKTGLPTPYNNLIEGFKFVCICSIPQGGKTSMLISWFRDPKLLKKCFNNIILVIPKQSLKSLKDKDNPFKNLHEEKIFHSLEDIAIINEMCKIFASEKQTTCLIIDDMTSYFKDPFVARELTDIIQNRRHYRTSVILLTQLWNRMPLSIRKLCNISIVLHKPSKKELALIFDEVLEQKEEIAEQIGKIAFKQKYDFLMILPETQKIYANYDEIVIED